MDGQFILARCVRCNQKKIPGCIFAEKLVLETRNPALRSKLRDVVPRRGNGRVAGKDRRPKSEVRSRLARPAIPSLAKASEGKAARLQDKKSECEEKEMRVLALAQTLALFL